MAHEIDTTVNEQGAALYANVPAWHGLGTVLDHAFTSDEALALAGVDFTVEKKAEDEFALVGKTAWGIYNGAGEYADHGLKYRGENAKENHFTEVMQGRVDDFKTALAERLVA